MSRAPIAPVALVGVVALVGLVALVPPGSAWAQAQAAAAAEDKAKVEEARRFFDAGRQAYESGQYAVAITAFEEALKLSPRPPVMFSLAQAYRRQYFVDKDPSKLKRGLDLYKQYVVEVKQGGRRDDAVQYIAELEPILGRVEDEQRRRGMGPVQAMPAPSAPLTQLMVSSRTKEAFASIDGGELGEVPLIREVKPGTHKVRIEAAGYFPEETEGVAVEGRLVVVEVPLREKPAQITVRTSSAADVAIDGRPMGSPGARPFEVAAGKHLVTVTRRGHYPITREVTIGRGEAISIDAPLQRTTQRKLSTWMFGGAAAVAVAGGVTTTLAFVHQGRAEDVLDRRKLAPITPEERAEYDDERRKRDDLVDTSYLLYGGALALAATGALLYFVDNPRVEGATGSPASSPAPESAIVPTASAGFLGAAWVGTF
jgi:tetratricopeptide (TPR) repeat protein